MTNPKHDPEDRELEMLRCPCDNEQSCCSTKLTSPKGFITILFWDCQAMTEKDMDDDLSSLVKILVGDDEIEDDDETQAS